MIAHLDCTPNARHKIRWKGRRLTLITRSFFISARVGREPGPGRLDDQAQVLKLRLPTKLLLDFIRAGDEHRGISSATRRYSRLDFAAGDFTRSVNYFLDGIAVTATAEV